MTRSTLPPGLAVPAHSSGPGRAQANANQPATPPQRISFERFQSSRTRHAAMDKFTGDARDAKHAGWTYEGGMWLVEAEGRYWIFYAEGDWDYSVSRTKAEAMLYDFALDLGKVVRP
jgi:hypothetical protein